MDGVKSCPARSFERTCAANDAWGCAMYGLILSRDKSDPRNSKRALDMFEKACQFGENDPACRSATSLKRDLR
jgi:TPR repeat protein